MKRIVLTVILLLSFLFSALILPHNPSDAVDSVPAGWVGIYDRAGLEAISSAPEKQYILMSDIDLSGTPWTALCSSDVPFTGTLDGNGRTVYNMTVSDPVNPCGLISYLSGGTVHSLTVRGTASGPIAGLVVGKAGGGTIRNCRGEGSVNSDFFGGGICGQVWGRSVVISGCTSSATLSGNGSGESELFLGGICGGVYGTGQVLSDCEYTGTLTPAGPQIFAGGIAGELRADAGGIISVVSCRSFGSLNLSSYGTAYAGGIVGRMSRGNLSISGCSFQGNWQGSRCGSLLFLGGIVGRTESTDSVEITKSLSSGTLSGVGHPNYQKDAAGDYYCTSCSVSLGKTVSQNSGTSVGFVNLDVTYPCYVGGIVGFGLADGGTLTVSQCSSSATLSATGTPVMLGGIAGANRSDGGNAVVSDCFFGGRLIATSPPQGEIASAVGGIAGFHGGFATATVERCVSVASPENAYVLGTGAVVGISGAFYQGTGIPQNQVSVRSCYTYAKDSYATALSGVQMSNPGSFAGFDFASLWQINPVTGLPNPKNAPITPPSLPKGDVDGNGIVTRLDGELLTRYLSGNAPFTAAQLQRADFDGNGAVNTRDVTVILQNVIQ